MMLVKKHTTPTQELMLAVCDKDLQGQVFTEGKLQLDCAADFFAGEPLEKDDVKSLLKSAVNVNVVGENSVACAKDAGIVEDANIKTIDGIPYAYIFRIDSE